MLYQEDCDLQQPMMGSNIRFFPWIRGSGWRSLWPTSCAPSEAHIPWPPALCPAWESVQMIWVPAGHHPEYQHHGHQQNTKPESPHDLPGSKISICSEPQGGVSPLSLARDVLCPCTDSRRESEAISVSEYAPGPMSSPLSRSAHSVQGHAGCFPHTRNGPVVPCCAGRSMLPGYFVVALHKMWKTKEDLGGLRPES